MRHLVPVWVLGVLLAGCAGPKIVVNGVEVYEREWEETLADLRPRARFDFACEASQVEYSLIKRSGRAPAEVGAAGCGRRGVYVRLAQGGFKGPWMLNTSQ